MRARALVARHGWLVAIAAIYLYVFPYFPRIQSANELPRVYLTKEIVDDGTFALDASVARWGGTGDMSPHGGHTYSNKSPGSSVLAVPVYAAAKLFGSPSLTVLMWLCRVFAGIVPALAFLVLLDRFLARFTSDEATRRLVVIAYALGSMAMTYSILFYSHQLSAICIASAWIFAYDVADGKRPWWWMAIVGFLAGCAPLVDYQAAFAGVPVLVGVIVKTPPRELPRALGIAAAGALLPIAFLLVYHDVCFGSPFATGYAASQVHAADHAPGFLGATYPKLGALIGITVKVDNGVFALSPWLLLWIPGTIVLAKKDLATALVGAANGLIFILFVASLAFWRAGWEVGPRYATAMLPFLLPAVTAQLDACRRWPMVVGVAAGTIVVGIVVYVLSSATFPYWPDNFDHPLFEVTFRLLGDNLASPSVGSALGIAGVAGVVPYFALAFGLAGVSIWRVAHRNGVLIAAGVALAILGAYWLVPHGGPSADAPYARTVRPAVVDSSGW
jgi:hypothetical protein